MTSRVEHVTRRPLPINPEPHIDEKSRKAKEQKIRGIYESVSVASVGIEMGLAVVVGWAIGYFLDKRFGTDPILMLVFLLVGVAAGFRGLLRVAKQARPKPESEAESESAASKERDSETAPK